MELLKGGAVQKRYIRGNDLVYADKGENTEKTYYVTDMHGNVVQLLDESGNVTKTYEYDSFGNEVKPEKKDENPYRYCGGNTTIKRRRKSICGQDTMSRV